MSLHFLKPCLFLYSNRLAGSKILVDVINCTACTTLLHEANEYTASAEDSLDIPSSSPPRQKTFQMWIENYFQFQIQHASFAHLTSKH